MNTSYVRAEVGAGAQLQVWRTLTRRAATHRCAVIVRVSSGSCTVGSNVSKGDKDACAECWIQCQPTNCSSMESRREKHMDMRDCPSV